jgi:hypothetical protein
MSNSRKPSNPIRNPKPEILQTSESSVILRAASDGFPALVESFLKKSCDSV